MTTVWTPEEIFYYMEQNEHMWQSIYEEIDKTYIIHDAGYPPNFSFKKVLYEYYFSGAYKIFKAERNIKLITEWLLQNPKINNYVRHPLTGDTIWHLHCTLTEILLPPIYDRKLNSLMDVYASHKDDILALENFYGSKVYTLLREATQC